MDKILKKSQLKKETLKVLGPSLKELGIFNEEEPQNSIGDGKDVNLYNDDDMYKVLLSDFLSMNDTEGIDSKPEGGSGSADYLFGADLSLT